MKNNKTILIIDDSTTNVILLDNLLSQKGYNILSAPDVREAMVLLSKNNPDLIILDLLMPFVDGYEFLNIIKGDEQLKSIPVLILSAVSDPEEILRAKSYGVVEYIKKPLQIKQFSAFIDSFFSNYPD